MFTLIWFLIGVACIPIAATLARRRERRPALWAVVAFLIGPLALVILALLPGPQCPHCRRRMKPNATVCGHCGRGVPPRDHAWERRAEPQQTFALGESWPPKEKTSEAPPNVAP